MKFKQKFASGTQKLIGCYHGYIKIHMWQQQSLLDLHSLIGFQYTVTGIDKIWSEDQILAFDWVAKLEGLHLLYKCSQDFITYNSLRKLGSANSLS